MPSGVDPITFRVAASFVLQFGDFPGQAVDDIARTDFGLRHLARLRRQLARASRRGRVHGHRLDALQHLEVYLNDGLIARDLAKLLEQRAVDEDESGPGLPAIWSRKSVRR